MVPSGSDSLRPLTGGAWSPEPRKESERATGVAKDKFPRLYKFLVSLQFY